MIGFIGRTGRFLIFVLLLGMSSAMALGNGPAAVSKDGVDDLRPIEEVQWNAQRAAHLFERAGFGATPRDIERSLAAGARATVARLVRAHGETDSGAVAFEPSGIPDAGIDPFPEGRPLATDAAQARGEAIGVQVKPAGNRRVQPVVDKFFFWLRASALECNRIGYWWANRMLNTERPLVEKMALF